MIRDEIGPACFAYVLYGGGSYHVDIVPFGHKICGQIANLAESICLISKSIFSANPAVFKGTFEWHIAK